MISFLNTRWKDTILKCLKTKISYVKKYVKMYLPGHSYRLNCKCQFKQNIKDTFSKC